MTPLILFVLAGLLSGPVPRALSRLPVVRRAPRAAMMLWQSVALAAVLSALGAGLALVTDSTLRPGRGGPWYVVALFALLLTAVVLTRLLLSAHRVGTAIRDIRSRHRAMVDLLSADDAGVRVLDHEAPTAYCLPGLQRSRVVVSAGAKSLLAPDEFAAVIAHERAHLRARHDLVLEAFTVLKEAFPGIVSSGAALREVRLLVEVLADRSARRRTGRGPLARALIALAGSPAPAAALGAAGTALMERIALINDDKPRTALAALLFAVAGALVALPTVFVAYPWLASLAG